MSTHDHAAKNRKINEAMLVTIEGLVRDKYRRRKKRYPDPRSLRREARKILSDYKKNPGSLPHHR